MENMEQDTTNTQDTPAVLDLCAAFEAQCSDETRTQIAVYYLTDGLAGALPDWWVEFEHRREIAQALNCPVWYVYSHGIFQGAFNNHQGETYLAIGQFVAEVRAHIRQHTPEQRFALKQQVLQQMQGAMAQAVSGKNGSEGVEPNL